MVETHVFVTLCISTLYFILFYIKYIPVIGRINHINFPVSKVEFNFLASKNVNVVSEGCQYFFNAQHLFLELKTLERCYFDFLCEQMNENNYVELDPSQRGSFIEFIHKIKPSHKTFANKTLLQYEKNYIKLGLVIKHKDWPKMHVVNPKYVFKGTSKKRVSLLYKLAKMAFDYKIDYSAIMDSSIDTIKPDPRLVKFCVENPINVNDI